jgi:hypothetical protein
MSTNDKWSFATEPGFENHIDRTEFVLGNFSKTNQSIALTNKDKSLVMHGIDACSPKQFANQTQRILVTNNFFVTHLLDNKYYEQFPDTFYGLFAGPVQYDSGIQPIKNFNCFIHRIDSFRQSWLYQLIRLDLFDQGFISFNLDISRIPGATDPIAVFQEQFEKYHSIFETEHQYIKSKLPYRNFSGNLTDVVLQSKFSIVLETHFNNNQIITFSEKIFRCLKLPRPWLLFSVKGGVNYLRKLGFDTLDDIVDHSYDQIDDVVSRQTEILKQTHELSKLEFTPELINRLDKSVATNNHVLNTFEQSFRFDVLSTLERARIKCMDL